MPELSTAELADIQNALIGAFDLIDNDKLNSDQIADMEQITPCRRPSGIAPSLLLLPRPARSQARVAAGPDWATPTGDLLCVRPPPPVQSCVARPAYTSPTGTR